MFIAHGSYVIIFFFTLWVYNSACGISVPQPETEPVPPAMEAQS